MWFLQEQAQHAKLGSQEELIQQKNISGGGSCGWISTAVCPEMEGSCALSGHGGHGLTFLTELALLAAIFHF
jgi:hypothetical protein